MTNVLIAGAGGPLGSYLRKELAEWAIPVSELVISHDILRVRESGSTNLIPFDGSNFESFQGVCEGIDAVVSILCTDTDTLNEDINLKANLYLLEEAKRAGIQKYIHLSLNGVNRGNQNKASDLGGALQDLLRESGLAYTIIHVNSLFSDARKLLCMARYGTIILFGNGEQMLNPIHEADLAEVCVKAIVQREKELYVGGPDILTQNEMAEMALLAWNKPPEILHLPVWIRSAFLQMVKVLLPESLFSSLRKLLPALVQSHTVTRYGTHRLQDFFNQEVQQRKQP